MANSEKNIGEQLSDAILQAIQTEDYSKLKTTVEVTINQAGSAFAAASKQAAADYSLRREQLQAEQEARQKSYQEQIERQQQERKQKQAEDKRSAALFASTPPKRVWTIVVMVFAVSLFLTGLGGVVDEFSWWFKYGYSIYFDTVVSDLIAAALGAALLVWGYKRLELLRNFDSYRYILGSRSSLSIEELAAQTGHSVAQVVSDLRKMIAKRLFKQGHLSDNTSLFMATNEEYAEYRKKLEASHAAAPAEILATLTLDAGEGADVSSGASVSGTSGTGGASDKTAEVSPRVQAILKRGDSFIEQIRENNKAIPGEEVTRKIDQIELVLHNIFKRAREHPEVVDDLDRLMNYYLPTTVKLLDAYRDLDGQPIQGENILKAKHDIEETLDALNLAFEKLLNSIFDDVVWDISTDVSVLQTVLAQEGLSEDPFKDKREV